MDLAQQFGAVKLKKAAGGTHDRSAPIVAGQEHDASSSVEQFKNKIHAVSRASPTPLHQSRSPVIDDTPPHIQEHTFATEFLDLSMDEARALVREFDCQRGRQGQQQQQQHDQHAQSDALALADLERKIDGLMGAFARDGGAFVRLSTRSPKDAVISSERTLHEWQAELARQGPEAERDENARLVALIKASTAALKVRSGREALALAKASERSNEDLLLALEFPHQWDMKIITRQWVEMHPAMEFRGFVCGKKLTALSQYFHIVHFPALAAHKDEIARRIQAFFAERIVDLIPLDNYVIDFGIASATDDIVADGGGGEVLVIELNPFNDYVGCGPVRLAARPARGR
ncbi:uncharacterized protein ACA1_389360 [Acanthamoeba castellanii str. Neff]|uniref:Cell division cycle protein 123 n=1 Tax=Acanthamoeba castellanii (strain ATCC 30010 / Neff) TaxID=1257118 RepID=L8GDL2_ACACF|nr:uncharacterized protein ACA1_389360 [Acanthamoeba castellanii str. Neff]ELR11215.1 hypothetical protein ACA1_389360 [Acanthamoeba castellanii str. Neff]